MVFRSIAFSGKKRIQKSSAQKIVTNRAGMRLGEMKAMEIFPVDLASAQKQSVWEDAEGRCLNLQIFLHSEDTKGLLKENVINLGESAHLRSNYFLRKILHWMLFPNYKT